MPEELRRGWTTGACAAAAVRAACQALATGRFPDPVEIVLPQGRTVQFALSRAEWQGERATAGVVKDAGDDPDVTHGALILATIRRLPEGSGVVFRAGEGVGTVTLPGLPLEVGEPAINPVPRRMMREAVEAAGGPQDVEITISIPGGERLAQRTLNARLGIVGGLSVLGTTGVVIPYSCSAWIASIQRGVDVARALGLRHLGACTGSVSERAVAAECGLPEAALLEMGDFAGGTFGYLRRNPVDRLTVGGGFAKLAKLAEGRRDLHSRRGAVRLGLLVDHLRRLGAGTRLVEEASACVTAAQVLALARREALPLGDRVALAAREAAARMLGPDIAVEVRVYDRQGVRVGHAPFGHP